MRPGVPEIDSQFSGMLWRFPQLYGGFGARLFEPLYKEVDGAKYDVANHEKVSTNGTKTKMTDSEAKKYLDADAYKSYQSKK